MARSSVRRCPWLTMVGAGSRLLRDRLAYGGGGSKRSGEAFAVLFLDLDRFKSVNDQYGHEAGNEILRGVAGEIRQAVRASDIAARYGGARVGGGLRAGIEGGGRRLG